MNEGKPPDPRLRGAADTVASVAALCALVACSDGSDSCNSALLLVTTQDESGHTVTVDGAEWRGADGKRGDCAVVFGGFSCTRFPAGRVELVISLAGQTWNEPYALPRERDCNAFVLHALTLTELAPCTPQIAVQGALVDANGQIVTEGSVQLRRTWPEDAQLSGPSVSCPLVLGRFKCPAIGYYESGDYVLSTIGARGSKNTPLKLVADACALETLVQNVLLP